MKKNLKIFFIVALFLTGYMFYASPVYPQSVNAPMPDLILACPGKLVKLNYSASKKQYDVRAETFFNKEDIKQAAVIDKNIFVITVNKILKFDINLKNKISKEFANIEALVVNDKNVFICAKGSFMALDKKLNELNKVNIGKNAHDILVYKDAAYLLDNIMMPLYVLEIDIKNPAKLEILNKADFSGVNAHLTYQWLNPQLNQWIVIQSYAHMGGSGQTARIYFMSGAKKEFTSQEIYKETIESSEMSRQEGFPAEEKFITGLKIMGVTPVYPVFAVAYKPQEQVFYKIGEKNKQNEQSKFSLCKIESCNNKISLSNVLKLDYKDDAQKFIVRQKNNYLFIIPLHGNNLKVIKMDKQPKVILSQKLNIADTVDLCVY